MPHHSKPAVLRETVAYIMGKHSASAARSRSLQCSSSSARELDTEPMHLLQSSGCSGLGRAVACRYQLFGTVEHPSSLDCGCRRPCGGGVHSHERHKVQAQSLWLGLHTHTTHARTDERTQARRQARTCVHVSMHGACSRGTKHSTRSLAGRVDENDLGAPSRSFSPAACTTTTKALRWKRHRGRSAGRLTLAQRRKKLSRRLDRGSLQQAWPNTEAESMESSQWACSGLTLGCHCPAASPFDLRIYH